jgi:hypothetical protein
MKESDGVKRRGAENRLRALGALVTSLVVNGGVLLAVALLGWDAREVLLLFWCEIALLVLLGPVAAGLFGGAQAALEAAAAMPVLAVFLAFHAFFLCGLLFGADWANAQGGPGGWSAPAIGTPPDWFAAAAAAVPKWALGLLVLVRVGHLLHDHFVAGPDEEAATAGVGAVILMHFAIVFGGSAILASGGAIGMLVLLVVLKLLAETWGAVHALRE